MEMNAMYRKAYRCTLSIATAGVFFIITSSQAQAGYSDARALYDWGIVSGPRVLGDVSTPLASGEKISGYLVQLEGKTFLAIPGKGLQSVELPSEVNFSDIAGKFVATEVSESTGGVAKLSLVVPAPAPTASTDAIAATDATATDTTATGVGPVALPSPGVKPDNRFMSFFDRSGENIGRLFRFSAVARAQYDASVADERLSEVKALLDSNNPQAAKIAADSYSSAIEKVGRSIEGVSKTEQDDLEKIRKNIAGHAALLQTDLITGAPEEFRAALSDASESTGKALASISDKRGEPPLTPETVERIQSAVALGSMSPAAASAIFSAKNRTEALSIVGSQVKSGLIASPDADYLRYDAVREIYKDSFDKGHEITKLEYIRKSQDDIKRINDDPALKQQIQDFGANFKEGNQPPEALRKAWALSVNAENAQQTFRPELLKGDQMKNEEFRQYYEGAKQQLAPTQGQTENLARQQSDSSRPLPQFQRVLQQAPFIGREDTAVQNQREGFGGCKNTDECVAKAKEFQNNFKDSTPDQRRTLFQQEFNRVDQRNQAAEQFNSQRPPMGTQPNNPIPGNAPGQMQGRAPMQNGQMQQVDSNQNKPNDFYTKDFPGPKEMPKPNPTGPQNAPRPTENRPQGGNNQPLNPGEARQYPGAPNSPSDANRPAGQYQPPQGQSGNNQNAPQAEFRPQEQRQEQPQENRPQEGNNNNGGAGAPPPPM